MEDVTEGRAAKGGVAKEGFKNLALKTKSSGMRAFFPGDEQALSP